MASNPKSKALKFIRTITDFIMKKITKMSLSELKEIKDFCEQPSENEEWWMDAALKPLILRKANEEILYKTSLINEKIP